MTQLGRLRRGGFGELTCVKEFGSFNNQYFLAFSEDRNEHTTQISSSVFRFDPGTESFRFLQSIPTDGAHGCELFTAQGSFLLAFANFGDRQGKRYKSKSSLWKYHEGDGIFRLIGEVKTQGATDVKHFTIENHDFLAISNEGDIQNRRFQVSAIFVCLEPFCRNPPVPFRKVFPSPGHPSKKELSTAGVHLS
mmetsp:Transcript_52400/g.162635  ORF Transcript_52400/g.162635 Transcript_52400/m.162635 type:complete len:193 (-) Transcript_52400:420-998(-)